MSLPTAFLNRMECLLGPEFPLFVRAMEESRAFGLRVNPLKCDLKEFDQVRFGLRPISWAREGFFYDPQTRPGHHPYYEAGVYYIQEPSAMAVGALADPKPGMRVLDLCAAPGGKTTHLAGRMMGQGILVANEIHPARAKILSQSVERAGVVNCLVTNETPQRLAQRFSSYFDCIVVDAPCSGEGMFRKEQIAVDEWTPDTPARCAARQDEILDCAVRMLRPGGRLVYSTCTFAPEENEGSIQRLLMRTSGLSVEHVLGDSAFSPGRPDWITNGCQQLVDTFRLFPHRLEGEGHFVAVLRREEGKQPDDMVQVICLSEREISKEYRNFERDTLTVQYNHLIQCGDQMWAIPEKMPDLQGLRVLRQGLQLGTLKKGRFEPAHSLALALNAKQVQRAVNFSAEGSEIIQYLKGQTLTCDMEPGWTLICVDGYSIGWGKVSNGMLKNHYPKGLRWK